jgi:hypothetical protein
MSARAPTRFPARLSPDQKLLWKMASQCELSVKTSIQYRDGIRAIQPDAIETCPSSSVDLTFTQSLLSLAGAVGIALVVPVVILLIGVPIALSVRGLTELVEWLFAVMF